ncbi:hypothetical protein M758_7G144600 [Ceratodon purpureus]|nr:hypothetical protein M758_7G144600 [Ceratodon purpureus]
MYKTRMGFKNGLPSPTRIRSTPGQKNMKTKVVVFFMTLVFFSLAVRMVSPPRQNPSPRDEEVNYYDHAAPVVQHLDDPMPVENPVPTNVAELIKKIKDTTLRASEGAENKTRLEFTDSMRAAWHAKQTCRSRQEIRGLYSLRKITKDVSDNPKWKAVYEAYEELHRTCVLQMGNVTEFFLNRKHIEGCKFVVAGVEPGAGLGNKVLSVVSAMVYAVVTQRILLVPAATAVPGVFCEPFAGSSWEIDPHKVWSEGKTRRDLWLSIEQMYSRIDSRGNDSHAMDEPMYASATTERWDFQPQPRFFCDTEQAIYSKVDWIGFRNNLYYVPKLFAVPSFRPVLEDLFPDRNVLTHLLRTLMLPCDSVWGRVKQVHDAHFRHADRRVGVQLRYFHGRADFEAIHQENEDNIEQCLIQNNFLPDPSQPGKPPANPKLQIARPMNVTTVLVTSLYQSLFDRLTKDFVRTSLDSGDAIGIVQLTHEGDQYFGVEVDRQALVEIISLSLMDHLILTPLSTFGALAQGYGSLTPWYIDLRHSTSTPCVRALSPEACYQIPASKHFICPHDEDVNGKKMTDVVDYISDCHMVEDPLFKVNSAGLGMQLLVSDRSGGYGDL